MSTNIEKKKILFFAGMDKTKTTSSIKTVYDCAPITSQDPKTRVRRQVDPFGPNRPRTSFRFSDVPANQIGSTLTRRQGPGENAISIQRVVSSSQSNEVSETVSESGSERSGRVLTSAGNGRVVGSEKRSNSQTSEVTENQTSSGGTSNVVMVRNGNSVRPNAIIVNGRRVIVPVNRNTVRPGAVLVNRQQTVPVGVSAVRPNAILVNRQPSVVPVNAIGQNAVLLNRPQNVVSVDDVNIQPAAGTINVNDIRSVVVPVNTNIQTPSERQGVVYVNNVPQIQNNGRLTSVSSGIPTVTNVAQNRPSNVNVMSRVTDGRQPATNSQVLDISVNAGKVNVQPGLRLSASDQARSGNVQVLDIRKTAGIMGVNSGSNQVPTAGDANMYAIQGQQGNAVLTDRRIDPAAATNVNVRAAVNTGKVTVDPQVVDLTVRAGKVSVNPTLNVSPTDQRRTARTQVVGVRQAGAAMNANSLNPAINVSPTDQRRTVGTQVVGVRQAGAATNTNSINPALNVSPTNQRRVGGTQIVGVRQAGAVANVNSVSNRNPQDPNLYRETTNQAGAAAVNGRMAGPVGSFKNTNAVVTSRTAPQDVSVANTQPAIGITGVTREITTLTREVPEVTRVRPAVTGMLPSDVALLNRPRDVEIQVETSNTVAIPTNPKLEVDVNIDNSNTVGSLDSSGSDIGIAGIASMENTIVAGPSLNAFNRNTQLSAIEVDQNINLQPEIKTTDVNIEMQPGVIKVESSGDNTLDLSNVVVGNAQRRNLDLTNVVVKQDNPEILANSINIQAGESDAKLAMVTKDEPNLPGAINAVNVVQTEVQTGLSDSNLIKEDALSDTKAIDMDKAKMITILSAEQQAANMQPASVSAVNVRETARGTVNQISALRPTGNQGAPAAAAPRPFVTSWVSQTGFRNTVSSGIVETKPTISSRLAVSRSNRTDNLNLANGRVRVRNVTIAGSAKPSAATVVPSVPEVVTTPIPLEWNVNGTYYDNSSYYGNYTGDGNYTEGGYYTDGNYTYYNGTMYPDYAAMYGNESMYGNYSFYNETMYPGNLTMPGNETEYYWNMTEPTLTSRTSPQNTPVTVAPASRINKTPTAVVATNRISVTTRAPARPVPRQTTPSAQMETRKYANIDFKNLSPGRVPYLPDYRSNLDNFGGVVVTGVQGTVRNNINARRDSSAITGDRRVNVVDRNKILFSGDNVATSRTTAGNTLNANLNNNVLPVNLPDPPIVDNVVNRPKVVLSYPLDSNSVAIGQVRVRNLVSDDGALPRDGTHVESANKEVDYYTLVNEIVEKLKLFSATESNTDSLPKYDTEMNTVLVGMGRDINQQEQRFTDPIRIPSSITLDGAITDIAPTIRDERRLDSGRTQIELDMPPIDVPASSDQSAEVEIRRTLDQFQGFPFASGERQRTAWASNVNDDAKAGSAVPVDVPPIAVSSTDESISIASIDKPESNRRGTGYDLINMVNNNQMAKTTFDFFNKNMLDRSSSKASAGNAMNNGISFGNGQAGNGNLLNDLSRPRKTQTAVKTIWENQEMVNGGNSMSYNGKFTYPGADSSINVRDLPEIRDVTVTGSRDASWKPNRMGTAGAPNQSFLDLTNIQPVTSQTRQPNTGKTIATSPGVPDLTNIQRSIAQADQTISQSGDISSATEFTPEYIASINRDIQMINDELMNTIKQTNTPVSNVQTSVTNTSDTSIGNDAVQSVAVKANINNMQNQQNTQNTRNVMNDVTIMASILNNTIRPAAQINQSLSQNRRVGSVLSNAQMEDVSLKILATLETIVKELQLSRELAIARHNLLSNLSLSSTAGETNNVNVVANTDVRGTSFDLTQDVPAIERKIGNVKTLAQNLDAIHKRLNEHVGMAESNPVWEVNPSLLSSDNTVNQGGPLQSTGLDANAGFQTETKQIWGANTEGADILSSLLGLSSNATAATSDSVPLDASLQNRFDTNSGTSSFLLDNSIRDNSMNADLASLQTANAIGSSIADIYQSIFGVGSTNIPSTQVGNTNAAASVDQGSNMNELFLQNQLYDLSGVTEQQKQQIINSLNNAYAESGASYPGLAAPFNSDPLVYVCPNGETFSCKPVGQYNGIPGMEWWCFNHCKNGPGSGSCPKNKCQCTCNPTNTEKAKGAENMMIKPYVSPKEKFSNENGTISKPGENENSVLRKKIFKKVITLTLNGSKENAVQVNDKGPEIMVSRAPQIITDTRAPSMNYLATADEALRDSGKSTANEARGASGKSANIGAVKENIKSIRKSQLNIVDNRLVCRGKGKFENIEGIVDWCTTMCRQGMCPGFVCTCWS